MRLLQEKIISDLHVQPSIDPKKEIKRTISFLKNYLLANSKYQSYILAVSGGQDSTLAGKIAQTSINELNEKSDKKYKFIAVRQPYGKQLDEESAQLALKFIKPDKIVTTNIKTATDALTRELRTTTGLKVDDKSQGSIKPKIRMIAQYAIARENKGVVIGTDHAAEAFAGFFTKYGDGGTDIDPLWRLNKRQGKAMLKELRAPEKLYKKTPTADLEMKNPLLPDEVALGVSYHDIDNYLEGKKVSKKAAERIEKLYLSSKDKRHLPVNVYDTWWIK